MTQNWRKGVFSGLLAAATVLGAQYNGASAEAATLYSGTVDSLVVENWSGPVVIRAHNAPNTVVRSTTGEQQVDGLQVSKAGSKLIVRGSGAPLSFTNKDGSHGGTVIVGESTVIARNGGQSTVIIGNLSQSADARDEKLPVIEISAPVGQPVALKGALGQVTVGNIKAPVDMDVAGACEIGFGHILSSTLKADGACDVTVAYIQGDLALYLDGAGELAVQSGEIGRLDVALNGVGDIVVDASAETARIRLTGAGDILVRDVQQAPDVVVDGFGDVTIGRF